MTTQTTLELMEIGDKHDYQVALDSYLTELTDDLHNFMNDSTNKEAFPFGAEKHTYFSLLTGLNDAAFGCDFSKKAILSFIAGGIELPQALVTFISHKIRLHYESLPFYAMVTGNTEQRYLGIFFPYEPYNMFRAVVEDRLTDFAGGGVGILNLFLESLPPEINLFKVSNHITFKENNSETGKITLVGHWQFDEATFPKKQRQILMKTTFNDMVKNIEIKDIDGNIHEGTLQLEDFSTPEYIYPRIFISYSIGYEEEKLHWLRHVLWENDFHPVLGTELGEYTDEYTNMQHLQNPPDIVKAAFKFIDGCVGFISLIVKREDCCIKNGKYLPSLWTVAEETYAWTRGITEIIRLKDNEVESPPDKHILEYTFLSNKEGDYQEKVNKVIEELKKFRDSRAFPNAFKKAREQLYKQMD